MRKTLFIIHALIWLSFVAHGQGVKVTANKLSGSASAPPSTCQARDVYLQPDGDLYLCASGVFVLSGGGGTTINSTNGQLPYRVNATTFGDSALASNALNSTYLSATSGASGAGLTLTVAGGGSNENLILAAKGTGSITSSFNYITAGATIGYYTYLSSSGLEGVSGGTTLKANGTQILGINYLHNYALVRSDGGFGWSSGSTLTGSPNTGFVRSAAGVIRATNGSTGAGQLLIGTSTDTADAQLSVYSQSTMRPGLKLRALSGTSSTQTAFENYSAAGTLNAQITSDGKGQFYSLSVHVGSGIGISWAEMGGSTLGVAVGASGNYSWSGTAGNAAAAKDLLLERDAANTLAQRNGTNAQTLRVYNTYTDASNNEYIRTGYASNIAYVHSTANGTGTIRNMRLIAGLPDTSSGAYIDLSPTGAIQFARSGVADRWAIDVNGHFVASSDNTYDIGASGATRPRSVFVGTSIIAPQIYAGVSGNACVIRSGAGSPESAVTGNVCDLYLRTDGGASTTMYIKESGTGNTGWVAK